MQVPVCTTSCSEHPRVHVDMKSRTRPAPAFFCCLWYMAWACSWAYLHFSFLVCLCTHRLVHGLGLQLGLFTFLMFLFVCACTAYRPWYMAWTCSSTYYFLLCVQGLDFFFLWHVLGICIVPWDCGSCSLSVAGVGVASQMPNPDGWRFMGAASNHTHIFYTNLRYCIPKDNYLFQIRCPEKCI